MSLSNLNCSQVHFNTTNGHIESPVINCQQHYDMYKEYVSNRQPNSSDYDTGFHCFLDWASAISYKDFLSGLQDSIEPLYRYAVFKINAVEIFCYGYTSIKYKSILVHTKPPLLLLFTVVCKKMAIVDTCPQ